MIKNEKREVKSATHCAGGWSTGEIQYSNQKTVAW